MITRGARWWRNIVGCVQMTKLLALRIRCAVLDPGHYKRSDQVASKTRRCLYCKDTVFECQKCGLVAQCKTCGVLN